MRARNLVGLLLASPSLFMMAVMFFVLCSSSSASAQTFYGAVVGTVTDATGAVVAGANVRLTNLGTNETRAEKTSNAARASTAL